LKLRITAPRAGGSTISQPISTARSASAPSASAWQRRVTAAADIGRNCRVGPGLRRSLPPNNLKAHLYRVVYFATHALVSGETEQAVKGLAEPVLVLSFPATATAFDDGLLTSNEVAQLKLNAGGTRARGGRPVHADAKVRHRPIDVRWPMLGYQHGRRQPRGCRWLAEWGASAKQIAAVSGHKTMHEIERYTTAADQKKLSRDAIAKLPSAQLISSECLTLGILHVIQSSALPSR